ncbi:hypothetical protein GEMRC1_003061 [Eukaryota sp. GEM-RC1]
MPHAHTRHQIKQSSVQQSKGSPRSVPVDKEPSEFSKEEANAQPPQFIPWTDSEHHDPVRSFDKGARLHSVSSKQHQGRSGSSTGGK